MDICKCINCGYELFPTDTVCDRCGTKVSREKKEPVNKVFLDNVKTPRIDVEYLKIHDEVSERSVKKSNEPQYLKIDDKCGNRTLPIVSIVLGIVLFLAAIVFFTSSKYKDNSLLIIEYKSYLSEYNLKYSEMKKEADSYVNPGIFKNGYNDIAQGYKNLYDNTTGDIAKLKKSNIKIVVITVALFIVSIILLIYGITGLIHSRNNLYEYDSGQLKNAVIKLVITFASIFAVLIVGVFVKKLIGNKNSININISQEQDLIAENEQTYTAMDDTDEEETKQTDGEKLVGAVNNISSSSGFEYYRECPELPTVDSAVSGVILNSHSGYEYEYYLGTDEIDAGDKIRAYAMVLFSIDGIELEDKGSGAYFINKNGNTLAGFGSYPSDNGSCMMLLKINR